MIPLEPSVWGLGRCAYHPHPVIVMERIDGRGRESLGIGDCPLHNTGPLCRDPCASTTDYGLVTTKRYRGRVVWKEQRSHGHNGQPFLSGVYAASGNGTEAGAALVGLEVVVPLMDHLTPRYNYSKNTIRGSSRKPLQHAKGFDGQISCFICYPRRWRLRRQGFGTTPLSQPLDWWLRARHETSSMGQLVGTRAASKVGAISGSFFSAGSSPNFGSVWSPDFGPGSSPPLSPDFGTGLSPGSSPRSSPNFGTGSSPDFGTGSSPDFGSGSSPGFGTGWSPVFGTRSSPDFRTESSPDFATGSNPGFGTRSSPDFGTGSSPDFGTGSSPNFGTRSSPAFGTGFGPDSGTGCGLDHTCTRMLTSTIATESETVEGSVPQNSLTLMCPEASLSSFLPSTSSSPSSAEPEAGDVTDSLGLVLLPGLLPSPWPLQGASCTENLELVTKPERNLREMFINATEPSDLSSQPGEPLDLLMGFAPGSVGNPREFLPGLAVRSAPCSTGNPQVTFFDLAIAPAHSQRRSPEKPSDLGIESGSIVSGGHFGVNSLRQMYRQRLGFPRQVLGLNPERTGSRSWYQCSMSKSGNLGRSGKETSDAISIDLLAPPIDELNEAIEEILPDGNYHSFGSVQEREDFWLTWRHLMPLHRGGVDHGGNSIAFLWPDQPSPRGNSVCSIASSALMKICHLPVCSALSSATGGSEDHHRSCCDGIPRLPFIYPFIRLQLRATHGVRVESQSYRNGCVAAGAKALIKVMLSEGYSVLAAPQVGIGHRMIAVRCPVIGGHSPVIKLPPWQMDTVVDNANGGEEIEVFINPHIIMKGKITIVSEGRKKDAAELQEEGVGIDPSLPFVTAFVRRPAWVVAQARTVDDRLVFMLFCGKRAGSFQRAMDYLDGFLSIDVATPDSKYLTDQQLWSLEKKAARFTMWHPTAAVLAFYKVVSRSALLTKTEQEEEEKKREVVGMEGGDMQSNVSREYGGSLGLHDELGERGKLISTTLAVDQKHREDDMATCKLPKKDRMDCKTRVLFPKEERVGCILPRVDHPACFTAYHEAGHAVVGRAFTDHVRVEGVFLEMARGRTNRAAGDAPPLAAPASWSWSGGTEIVFLVSNKDDWTLTIERMAVWLGGLISEELMFGRADMYDGPLCSGSFADDIVNVGRTARKYLDACMSPHDWNTSALHSLSFWENPNSQGGNHVPTVASVNGEMEIEAMNQRLKTAAAIAGGEPVHSRVDVKLGGSNLPSNSAAGCPDEWRVESVRGGRRAVINGRCRPLGLPRNGPYDSRLLAMIDEAYEIGRQILVRDVDKLHRLASLLMDKRLVKENHIQEIWNE